MSTRAKTTAGTTSGSFAPEHRAEADVDLPTGPAEHDPSTMSRDQMLDDPDLRFAPKEWMAAKHDHEIATMLTDIRTARLRAVADVEQPPAPDWLRLETMGTQRRYATADGYDGRDLVSYLGGHARLIYRISGPAADGSYVTGEFDDIAQMAGWVEGRRAERAEAWKERFPVDSAASRVSSFRGKPVDVWLPSPSTPDGQASYVAADGSYVSVTPDDEDTGHWYIDGVWADGTDFDGGSFDSSFGAQRRAEETLLAGKTAYEKAQRTW